MSYLLGIDIGTSGTKTVLFDLLGNTVASSVKEYPLYQPQAGWAEQDPGDWWDAVCHTIKNVLYKSGINPSDIKGVGLSGQMHGAVLLDKSHTVLRKAIIWCDQRSASECEQITGLIGAKKLIEISANPALTAFTASKVQWVKNNEPHLFEKIDKILLPKDYIRLKLTGEFASEVSDASGMQYMDVPNRTWSRELLEKLDIDIHQLGTLYESQEITGKVSNQAAQLTGLSVGTPVVGGAGDQAAGAIGNGIVRPGVVSSTIGTSGVVFAFCKSLSIDPLGRVHTFCHAVPNTWHIMGVTQAAGLSLKWFRDIFCAEEKKQAELSGVDPYLLMDNDAGQVPPGANGILYLPYLMGERTPYLDPSAKGVFFGLTAKHEKRDLLRAVMEGVTFSLRDCFEIIKEMGVPVSEIRASGGGGKSRLWCQIQADVFGAEVRTVNSGEGPALGVALLAGVGIGLYKSIAEACDTAIHLQDKLLPSRSNYPIYEHSYAVYRQLYHALKQCFQDI